jgi:hypothetical protein
MCGKLWPRQRTGHPSRPSDPPTGLVDDASAGKTCEFDEVFVETGRNILGCRKRSKPMTCARRLIALRALSFAGANSLPQAPRNVLVAEAPRHRCKRRQMVLASVDRHKQQKHEIDRFILSGKPGNNRQKRTAAQISDGRAARSTRQLRVRSRRSAIVG